MWLRRPRWRGWRAGSVSPRDVRWSWAHVHLGCRLYRRDHGLLLPLYEALFVSGEALNLLSMLAVFQPPSTR